MKNKSVIISVLLCVLCVFAVQISRAETTEADELSYTFDFTQPVITKSGDYDQVSMEGCEISHKTGKPLLPFKGITVLLPEGKEVSEVICEPEDEVTIPGSYLVKPAAQPYPLSRPELRKKAVPDAAIYNSDTPYPEKVSSPGLPQTKKGYNLLFVNLYPVRYIPAKGELSYFKRIKVRLVLESSKRLGNELGTRDLASDREEISWMVTNPEVLKSYGN